MLNLKKIGIDDHIYKAELDTDLENKCMDTMQRRGGRMNWEFGIDIYIYAIREAHIYILLCIK